jgi:hypothetical protein
MGKQNLEIDVPEGWRIAGYRTPLEGEYYLHDGEAVEAIVDFTDDRIVLVADWRWPNWLKAGWIAMNKDGQWVAFNFRPFCGDMYERWGEVIDTTGELVGGQMLDPDMFRFDPPPCDDWKQSLRQNPAYQVKL